ncbi:L-alanine-DL-glutamate epimerase-like enolase superfamily enzyme [Bradyrhizobium sp. GM2.2]
MIKPVHPFRFARIERLRELLERDYRMAVDANTGVSTTKLVRPDPQLLDAVWYSVLQEGASWVLG